MVKVAWAVWVVRVADLVKVVRVARSQGVLASSKHDMKQQKETSPVIAPHADRSKTRKNPPKQHQQTTPAIAII